MKWIDEHCERVKPFFPKPHSTVTTEPLIFLQALQYIAENGCRWRALPETFGNWNTLYCRFRYWIDLGIFDLIEKEFQSQMSPDL